MSYNPLVKICGITSSEILDAAVEAGADMVGFVHYERSPRHLDIDTIARLLSEARGRVETVVLLVNPDNSLIAEIAAFDPDWLQLHGPESPARVEAIRQESGAEMMKAVGVGGPEDLETLKSYVGVADRLLLDAKPPKGSARPGGLGRAFDWSLLKSLDPSLSIVLSGGLTPDNVADALTQVRPFGIDVSSGVEHTLGEKDAGLIRSFIVNARAAAAKLSDIEATKSA